MKAANDGEPKWYYILLLHWFQCWALSNFAIALLVAVGMWFENVPWRNWYVFVSLGGLSLIAWVSMQLDLIWKAIDRAAPAPQKEGQK